VPRRLARDKVSKADVSRNPGSLDLLDYILNMQTIDERLLQLRRESYKAAADYYRAMEHWQTVSRAQEKGEELKATLQQCRDIAATYHNALGAVSAHLRTLEPAKLVTEEIGRVLKLQALLDREIKLIF
jgi:hypothetical protein